ncbi:MAG: HdeD family acid-resistance protein [Aristaeellaceae bacterium]
MSIASRASSIIVSLCEAVVGILLLVNPSAFTRGIIVCVGVVLLIFGVLSVAQYFRDPPAAAALKRDLTLGCIEILAGLFCILNSGWFLAAFPVLTVLYGVGILIVGLSKVQWMLDKIRLKSGKWFWLAVSAVLTIVCAVIILCNPFGSTAVLWTFIAISLIVEAIVDIIVAIFARKGRA